MTPLLCGVAWCVAGAVVSSLSDVLVLYCCYAGCQCPLTVFISVLLLSDCLLPLNCVVRRVSHLCC